MNGTVSILNVNLKLFCIYVLYEGGDLSFLPDGYYWFRKDPAYVCSGTNKPFKCYSVVSGNQMGEVVSPASGQCKKVCQRGGSFYLLN